MNSRLRLVQAVALLGLLLIGAGGCRKPVPSAPAGDNPAETLAASSIDPPGFSTPRSDAEFAAKLSPAELKWGASVTPDPKVTYQDDVVVLPHGADAVRGMEPNGLTWLIDANAPGADGIAIDKIVFATGRVVGRVLAVERNGDALKVMLGPVELTEVIKECDISIERPVDLGSMLTYTAPGYPGAVAQMPKESESGQWEETPASATFADYLLPSRPVANGLLTGPTAFSLTIDDFTFQQYCCGGIGVKLLHKGSDAIVVAYAIVHLDHPNLKFDLVIQGGKIRTALVSLSGGAGFTVYFNAATTIGSQGNIDAAFYVPSDLSIPISGLGVPFAITFRQTMVLTTAFTAKQAIIGATGDYGFSGALKMGLDNGTWGVDGPQTLTIKESMLGSLTGASLGVNGLTFAYGGKVMVGIGAFGFITGPYLSYNTAVGATRGSDATPATPPCKSVKFEQWMAVGVGYQIPQMVTRTINAILEAIGIRKIQGSGGFQHTEPLTSKYDKFPAGC